jgi:hypothetical protein
VQDLKPFLTIKEALWSNIKYRCCFITVLITLFPPLLSQTIPHEHCERAGLVPPLHQGKMDLLEKIVQRVAGDKPGSIDCKNVYSSLCNPQRGISIGVEQRVKQRVNRLLKEYYAKEQRCNIIPINDWRKRQHCFKQAEQFRDGLTKKLSSGIKRQAAVKMLERTKKMMVNQIDQKLSESKIKTDSKQKEDLDKLKATIMRTQLKINTQFPDQMWGNAMSKDIVEMDFGFLSMIETDPMTAFALLAHELAHKIGPTLYLNNTPFDSSYGFHHEVQAIEQQMGGYDRHCIEKVIEANQAGPKKNCISEWKVLLQNQFYMSKALMMNCELSCGNNPTDEAFADYISSLLVSKMITETADKKIKKSMAIGGMGFVCTLPWEDPKYINPKFKLTRYPYMFERIEIFLQQPAIRHSIGCK